MRRVPVRRSIGAVVYGCLVSALVLVSSFAAAAAELALTTEIVRSPDIVESSLPTLTYGVSLRASEQLELIVSYNRAAYTAGSYSAAWNEPALGVRWRFGQGAVTPHAYAMVGFPSMSWQYESWEPERLSGRRFEIGAGVVAALTNGTELIASVGYGRVRWHGEEEDETFSAIVPRLGVRFPLGF